MRTQEDRESEDQGAKEPGAQGARNTGVSVSLPVQRWASLPHQYTGGPGVAVLHTTTQNTEEQNWLICQHSASASKKSVIHGISEDETTNSTGISLRSRTLKTLFIHCKAAVNADTLTKVSTLPSCPSLTWQPTLQDGLLNTLRNQNKERYNANVLIMFIYFKKRYLLSVSLLLFKSSDHFWSIYTRNVADSQPGQPAAIVSASWGKTLVEALTVLHHFALPDLTWCIICLWW